MKKIKTLDEFDLRRHYHNYDVSFVVIDDEAFAYESKDWWKDEFEAWQVDENFNVVNNVTIRHICKLRTIDEIKKEYSKVVLADLLEGCYNKEIELPNGHTLLNLEEEGIFEIVYEIV